MLSQSYACGQKFGKKTRTHRYHIKCRIKCGQVNRKHAAFPVGTAFVAEGRAHFGDHLWKHPLKSPGLSE